MVTDAVTTATASVHYAVEQYDAAAAAAAVAELCRAIDVSEFDAPSAMAVELMKVLRRRRWFEPMLQLGEALLRNSDPANEVRREYAQALIADGRVAAGRDVLLPLLAATEDDADEHAEVRGLLGRAYKQMYIDAGAPGVARHQQQLRKAAEYYYETYELDKEANHWHGVNTVALVDRARRDRVPFGGFPDVATVAAEILETVRSKAEPGSWECASALEASVALGDADAALEWAGKYLESADAFEAASTLRQLDEVWNLEPEGEFGVLLTVLGAAMISGKEGLDQTITAEEKAALDAAVEAVDEQHLERILGETGVLSLDWYRQGLQRSEGVALISDESGRGVGSGFLVLGKDLSPKLPEEEAFVLTNAHVVAEEPSVRGTLYPDQASVSFEAIGAETKHEVEKVMWSSPPTELDATLLRISPPAPVNAVPVPIAKRMPRLDQRVYIIGHPLGGGLSFSLQDNLMLDHVDPKLHYRTPTEPGSSGSAVFNEAWKVVALHHAGGLELPRLSQVEGEPDRYAANEGLVITAITNKLDAELELDDDG